MADITPADQYERLKDNPDLQVVIEKPFRWVVGVFNTVKPPFNDVRVRQAALAAVNPAEVMAAAIGPQAFWRLDPGLQFQEQVYHSTAGAEYYNQNNPEKALRLLQEAGYSGQPVVLLTTKDYEYMYKTALVTKSQLEAAAGSEAAGTEIDPCTPPGTWVKTCPCSHSDRLQGDGSVALCLSGPCFRKPSNFPAGSQDGRKHFSGLAGTVLVRPARTVPAQKLWGLAGYLSSPFSLYHLSAPGWSGAPVPWGPTDGSYDANWGWTAFASCKPSSLSAFVMA